MTEATIKPRRAPRAKSTGPRVFIVTMDGKPYHITATDFRVATQMDTIGLLNGDIKALQRSGAPEIDITRLGGDLTK